MRLKPQYPSSRVLIIGGVALLALLVLLGGSPFRDAQAGSTVTYRGERYEGRLSATRDDAAAAGVVETGHRIAGQQVWVERRPEGGPSRVLFLQQPDGTFKTYALVAAP